MDATITNRLEYHRNALALFPEKEDTAPGVAVLVSDIEKGKLERYCSCSTSKTKTCGHIKSASRLCKELSKTAENGHFDAPFKNSKWHVWAKQMAEADNSPLETVRLTPVPDNPSKTIRVLNAKNDVIFVYYPPSSGNGNGSGVSHSDLFHARMHTAPDNSRSSVWKTLYHFTQTPAEQQMAGMGKQTIRMAFESSFWYRAAYHLFRTAGSMCTFSAEINDTDGQFTVDGYGADGKRLFQSFVRHEKVLPVLSGFKKNLTNRHDMAIAPHPLSSILKIDMNEALDINMKICFRYQDADGSPFDYEKKELKPFHYGSCIYLKDQKKFAAIPTPDTLQEKFGNQYEKTIPASKIPALLDKFGDDLWDKKNIIDNRIKNLKIYKTGDRIRLFSHAIDQSWYYLSVYYGFGDSDISLAEIIAAKKEGKRYLQVKDGWVDCIGMDIDALTRIPNSPIINQIDKKDTPLKLRLADLYRIQAASDAPLGISGKEEFQTILKNRLEMTPSQDLPELAGMTSRLRSYQKRGTEWLYYLYENRFGGILCDDMGLGKTHQTMALFVFVREQKKSDLPFLVVAPTSVLHHWQDKITVHAPALSAKIYHDNKRDLDNDLKNTDVLITSYGILRQDSKKFNKTGFEIVVFDEAQLLKNRTTQIYQAALMIPAAVKFGLTGTPIENRLNEIKAILDITVPGYLGTDNEFEFRYERPIQNYGNMKRKKELSRLVSPFTLRRLKKTVLHELPEKIENILTCELSQDQIKLYREAVQSKGKDLLKTLKAAEEKVPYLHIFALLNKLKQICDHPALIDGTIHDYDRYQSGKFELFKEILTQSIESGQKIVIYSQYLSMIKIIQTYIETLNINCVTLTGASQNRGKIISTFNNDPDCRVFIGSLIAGGTGIDLVSASVVIHYDRWWNAAKEDQATDRVHRIGQTRGVQVFKLVTQGTLEEKISAMIEKKKNLMDSIVREDDPELLKTFSREQLIDLLS